MKSSQGCFSLQTTVPDDTMIKMLKEGTGKVAQGLWTLVELKPRCSSNIYIWRLTVAPDSSFQGISCCLLASMGTACIWCTYSVRHTYTYKKFLKENPHPSKILYKIEISYENQKVARYSQINEGQDNMSEGKVCWSTAAHRPQSEHYTQELCTGPAQGWHIGSQNSLYFWPEEHKLTCSKSWKEKKPTTNNHHQWILCPAKQSVRKEELWTLPAKHKPRELIMPSLPHKKCQREVFFRLNQKEPIPSAKTQKSIILTSKYKHALKPRKH